MSAQFGHPLKGQWSGQWGPADSPKRLLLDLHWDGKAITGVINPGPERGHGEVGHASTTPIPSAWEREDAGRREGRVRQAGADPRGRQRSRTSAPTCRLFHGTWTQGGQKGEFTVTRN